MAVTVFTAEHDAEFYADDTDLATTRALSSADSIDDAGTTLDVGGKASTPFQLWRVGLTFDTSSIPSDAIITGVQLFLYFQTHIGSVTHRVVDFNPAVDPYVVSDFGNFTTTTWGSRAFTVGNTGVQAIDLATGCVVKAGTTYLGMRAESDVTGTGTDYRVSTFRSVRYGGGSTFYPRLSVIWTPATQTASPTIVGTTPGTLTPTARESNTVAPSIVGTTPGPLTPTVSNAGGIVTPAIVGAASGTFAPNVSVAGVANMRPSIVGVASGVGTPSLGAKPRLLGPFSAVVDAPLRDGDRCTLTAYLRKPGDEPLDATAALGVDLYALADDGTIVANWAACTVADADQGKITYTFEPADLTGVQTITVIWKVRWQGGQTLAPSSPLTLAVT